MHYFNPDGRVIRVAIKRTCLCSCESNQLFSLFWCVYPLLGLFLLLISPAHSAASSKDRVYDSPIEVIAERQRTPHRPVTQSQLQASIFISIRLRLRMSSPSTLLKPSRILRPRNGAKQPVVSTLHAATRIPTSFSRSVPQTPSVTFSGFSNSHVRLAPKRPRPSLLNPGPSKRYASMMILICAVFLNVTLLLATSLQFRFRVVKVGFPLMYLFLPYLIRTHGSGTTIDSLF